MPLVVVARYYDLPAARLAESFLRDAGLSPSVADDALTTMNPLFLRAVGGLRLSVLDTEVEAARDLLARAEAGEFATPLEPEDELDFAGPAVPRPAAIALALTAPEAAYGVSRRSLNPSWVRVVGIVLILMILAGIVIGFSVGALERLLRLFG